MLHHDSNQHSNQPLVPHQQRARIHHTCCNSNNHRNQFGDRRAINRILPPYRSSSSSNSQHLAMRGNRASRKLRHLLKHSSSAQAGSLLSHRSSNKPSTLSLTISSALLPITSASSALLPPSSRPLLRPHLQQPLRVHLLPTRPKLRVKSSRITSSRRSTSHAHTRRQLL